LINLQAVLDLDRVLLGGGISSQPSLLAEIDYQFEVLHARTHACWPTLPSLTCWPPASATRPTSVGPWMAY
ncbi:MAG: hypothetical protein ACLUCR_05975, partial [Limosilactobacillus fermentum]